jgi:hypothetical protein
MRAVDVLIGLFFLVAQWSVIELYGPLEDACSIEFYLSMSRTVVECKDREDKWKSEM